MLRRPPSRLLRSLAIHACMGYAVGLALALFIAIVQVGPPAPLRSHAIVRGPRGHVGVTHQAGVGVSIYGLYHPIHLERVSSISTLTDTSEATAFTLLAEMSASELGVQFLADRSGDTFLREYRFGWPFRSMWFRSLVTVKRVSPAVIDTTNVRAVTVGLRGELPTNGRSWPRRTVEPNAVVLPTGVLLGGSIANGLLFGLVSLSLCRIRPVLRSLRGKCIGCGYTITGEPICPECGRERRERRGRATASSRTPASAEPSR